MSKPEPHWIKIASAFQEQADVYDKSAGLVIMVATPTLND